MNRSQLIKALGIITLAVLGGLAGLAVLRQADATTANNTPIQVSLRELDLYADHHGPITPTLTVNHALGQPGSYFVITGEDYAAYNCYRVMVNNHLVSPEPVCADGGGKFMFELSTPANEEGHYEVTVGVEGQTDATTSFDIDRNATTQWPAQGLTYSFEIPTGIANLLYLPLIIRGGKSQLGTTNLLINPGFEGIGVPLDNTQPRIDNWTNDTFTGQQFDTIQTPAGWVTWWEEEDFKRPTCQVIPNHPPFSEEPHRIYEGYYAGMCYTFFGKQHAGYYQVVEDIPPGSLLQASFYAHAWTSNRDYPPITDRTGDPKAFYFRVGIDPTGGTDAFSSDIMWSEKAYIYDEFEQVGPVKAVVGEVGTATMFMEAYGRWPNKHNDAYWDNPSLVLATASDLQIQSTHFNEDPTESPRQEQNTQWKTSFVAGNSLP